MQTSVHDAQFDLAHQRITKFASVSAGGFDTDKNFAVVKSDDVSRVTFPEELEMQFRDAPIGNEPDGNSIQLAQLSSFAFLQLQTTLQSTTCEPFQLGDVDRDFSLKVAHRNFWNRHSVGSKAHGQTKSIIRDI